ncbi:MAG: carboxypeptidase regulatory-like domain-containing protein [Lysobacteraceae bacterium]|nr:MAG: carboxypeptidase regulatory-like domain-containing protein [Xanthomonadaceae bacterium]
MSRFLPLAPTRLAAALALAGLLCAGQAVGAPAASPFGGYADAVGAGSAPQIQLAALVVNGDERHDALAVVQRAGVTLVALDYLVRALRLVAEPRADALVFATPLGEARVPRANTSEIQGFLFVDVATLAQAFGARMRFDRGEYALRVDLGWDPFAAAPGDAAQATPVPADIRAPRASLSRWRSEIAWRGDAHSSSWLGTTDLAGVVGPASWYLREIDDFESDRRVDLWALAGGQGHARYLVGRELSGSIGGLLPGFHLTGAQVAWSNRPRALFDAAYGDGLVASRLDAQRTLRGKGPPGGVAELRRDGQVVARTPIALDGHYEFRDQTRTGERIEVAVYEPGQADVPLRVDEIRPVASDRLLPEGAVLHHAGLGTSANPLDRLDQGGERAGFYQWRQGVRDGLTLMAAWQDSGARPQGAAGAVASLGALGVWSATLAHAGEGNAVEVYGDGARGALFWNGWFNHREAGFLDDEAIARADYTAEAGWRPRAGLAASLVARHSRGGEAGEVDFIKPALQWQPRADLALSLRPDYDGRYVTVARWAPLRDTTLGYANYRDQRQFTLDQRLPDRLLLRAQLVDEDGLGRRTGVYLNGPGSARWPFSWTLGALHGRGRAGYLLEGSGELRPGLLLRAQVLDDPLQRERFGGTGRIAMLSMVADFAVTPSGLARGGYRERRGDDGGISGRIVAGDGFDARRLAGVGVLLDGRWRGEVDGSGRFAIGQLPDGIYSLSLDSGELPLEYQPADPVRRVEVRAGAATRVDFGLALRLGFAGRVLDAAGEPLADRALEVFDAEGRRVATARSDAWGYYRIDGLAAGPYRVRAEGGLARDLRLEREFAFGIDLDARTPR